MHASKNRQSDTMSPTSPPPSFPPSPPVTGQVRVMASMMVMKVMVMKVVVSVQKDRVLYREGVSQRAACILKLYWQDTRVRSLGFACYYIIVYNVEVCWVEVWRCGGVFEWQSVCILSVLCLLWRWDRLIIWNKKRTGGQTRVCGGGGGGPGG